MNHIEANLFVTPIAVMATIIFIQSAYDGYRYRFFRDNASHNWEISILLMLSMMYFILDFVLMIRTYRARNNVYFAHHLVGIIGIYVVYFHYYGLIKYLLGYLIYEISTPFLNLSLFYKQNKINNWMSTASKCCFVVSFVTARIVFGTVLTYYCSCELYQLRSPGYMLIILPWVLQALNFWWFRKLIHMMLGCK